MAVHNAIGVMGLSGTDPVGVTTPNDARLALGALLATRAARAHTGIIYGGDPSALAVFTRTDWAYAIPAGAACIAVSATSGAYIVVNDGTAYVTTDPSPQSGSRIDLVWIRQADAVDGSDAVTQAEVGVSIGTPAASNPVRPSVPAGALILKSYVMPSTATNTNGATGTHEAAYVTAAGARDVCRNRSRLNTYGVWEGREVLLLDEDEVWRYSGSKWRLWAHDWRAVSPAGWANWNGSGNHNIKLRIAVVDGVAQADLSIQSGGTGTAWGDLGIILPDKYAGALESATSGDFPRGQLFARRNNGTNVATGHVTHAVYQDARMFYLRPFVVSGTRLQYGALNDVVGYASIILLASWTFPLA